ncbi:MAG: hypothetical protein QXN55_07930 [Candidatus Nitrosotenuis sp.]
MSFEGKRNLTVLFGVAAIAIVAFFAVSMFKDTPLVREKITEEVAVSGKIDNSCVVETNDPVMSSKKIESCDLPVGTKIKIIYQKSLPTAEIVK